MECVTIPIVFATNEKYAPYADVCISSIYANSAKNKQFEITIFHTGLSDDTIYKLEEHTFPNITVKCMDVSALLVGVSDRLYQHSYFSKEMYYRILIPRVFSDKEKVIYLDCDMVVLGDISQLYQLDLGDNMIAACRNLMHAKMHDYVQNDLHLNPNKYFNSGMLVFNIAQCDKNNFEDKFWEYIQQYNILRYPDQDLLNIVCQDKIFYLELEWNWLYHLERMQKSRNQDLHLGADDWKFYLQAKNDIKILHFTGDKKPWDYNALPMADIFWRYVPYSNFRAEVEQANRLINKPKVKLEFLDLSDSKIVLTCCLILPQGAKDNHKIYYNGQQLQPHYYYISSGQYNDNLCFKKHFKLSIPRSKMRDRNFVFFNIGAYPTLFEYDKYFPLNGYRESYFAGDGILIYRSDRFLIIEKCSLSNRIKHELSYCKALLSKASKKTLKTVIVRLCYFLLRKMQKSKIVLINDRPNMAGDNGEAMFRFLRETKPSKVRPYFIINKDSCHYERVKKIGRILSTGSNKLKFLNLFADVHMSSQTDFPVYSIMDTNLIKDIMYKKHYVFLQHGITKDDISQVYSRFFHNFSLFITAARPEYESIISNKAYGCDETITKLTGFARHDLLINATEKIILVAPTWRKGLLNDNLQIEAGDEFLNSEYYKRYRELLTDPELKNWCRVHGYQIWFATHPMLKSTLEYFADCFDEIVVDASHVTFNELFSKGTIMITDYSSNAFEFAYLRKPIIYYQFDKGAFFSEHTYSKGYFDYERDGFGSIVATANQLKEELDEILNNDVKMSDLYRQRVDSFFAFNDNKNRERIWNEVKKWL